MVDLGSYTSELRGGSDRGSSRERRERLAKAESEGKIIIPVQGSPDRPAEVRVKVTSTGGVQAPPPTKTTSIPTTTPTKEQVQPDVIKDRVQTPREKFREREALYTQRVENYLETQAEKERITSLRSKGNKKKLADVKAFGLGFAQRGVQTIKSFDPKKSTVQGNIPVVQDILRDPFALPGSVSRELSLFGDKLRTDTAVQTGGVAFDIATAAALPASERLVSRFSARASGKYVGKIRVGDTVKVGKQKTIEVRTTTVRKGTNDLVKTYHGTSIEGAKEIVKTGLNPKSYVGRTKTTGYTYADNFVEGTGKGALLEVKVPRTQLDAGRKIGKYKVFLEEGIPKENVRVIDTINAKPISNPNYNPKDFIIKNNKFNYKIEKPIELKIAQGVSSTSEPLSQQVTRAGTAQNPTSAAQDFFKTNKPGELVRINKPVPEGTPAIEKQFFADPTTRVRTSRLQTGTTPLEKTFAEEISLQLGTKEQQVIIFKDSPIASFPKELQPAIKNIRAGKTPTPQEARLLIEFQTTGKPGVFKAPGKPTIESEVTLLEGSIVESKGLKAITEYQGTPIKIFEAEVLTTDQASKILSSSEGKALRTSTYDISRSTSNNVRVSPGITTPVTRYKSSAVTTTRYVPTSINRSSSPVIRRADSNIIRGGVGNPPPTRTYSITSTQQTPFSGSRGKPPISQEPRITTQQPTINKQFRTVSNPLRPRTISRTFPTPGRPYPSYTTPKQSFFTPVPKMLDKPSRGLFTVQVLDKGIFRTVGKTRTRERAFSIGSGVVGGSALRTVRVLKNGSPVEINNKRFRRSKSKPGAFVERSKYAINTPGELFEIPGARGR